ncbi:MAG: response regulator [Limisphaerales bacterium]
MNDGDFFPRKIEAWPRSKLRFTCVASCADGETGFEAICAKQPALAVVDFGLPGIKGDQVIWRAKEQVPSVKIVSVSGIPDDSVVFRALSALRTGFWTRTTWGRASCFSRTQEVILGGFSLSERARKIVPQKWQECRPRATVGAVLTDRKREIAELACLGFTKTPSPEDLASLCPHPGEINLGKAQRARLRRTSNKAAPPLAVSLMISITAFYA